MEEIMPGVFKDRGNIYTKNSIRGKDVYGERLFTQNGVEYRQWDPTRSKLGAAIMKNVNLPEFSKDQVWLYLGSASGTTVSHLSDIIEDGLIYAVEFAHRVMRDFVFLAQDRNNLAPILADASHPENYEERVSLADIMFQDIAQKSQVTIFLRNLRYLKTGGYAILSLKARSIDVAAKPRKIFDDVRQELQKQIKIIDYKTLEPYEGDHAIFVCQKE